MKYDIKFNIYYIIEFYYSIKEIIKYKIKT